MSQRVKRPNRSEDGSVPVKRRKRTTAEEEEATSLATVSATTTAGGGGNAAGAGATGAAWQPPRSNDLKSIYNRTTTEAPAELFRKDLISAMKLPDSEPLASDEYWVIVDQWKQEWERGVQVPVNPDSLPEPSVSIKSSSFTTSTIVSSIRQQSDFKLPKTKYIRITKDENFKLDEHVLSNAPAKSEAGCSYDLDECDVAWLKILNAERASSGMGPINADMLERVIERLELCCWDKIQLILRNEEGLGIEYDENVICDVCRSPDSEEGNEMVFCDSCNICVHQACYGITRIPEGQWLCCTCNIGKRPECVLCPNKGGAMKCLRTGQKWAHVSCALWIPEVSIGCVEKMEPITKVSSIPSSRWALICVLCRERVGACIQCSVKTCKTAYHVTCAFKHGLEMRAIIEDENADDGVKLRSYCEKHSKSSKKEKSICSGSEDDDCKRKKRKDMTSEEKNQARAIRLQEIEAEFFKHVSVKDISIHFNLDNDTLTYVYNYWKLKRKAGFNRPLLPPKSEDVDVLSHKREQADLEKMKMFVQLRQDLERVRNLCYMVSRREKLSRTFFRMREQTFHKQAAVLDAVPSLPPSVIEAVIEANHGPSIYDRLYSHNEAEDHTNDFEAILARIAGKSPSHSGDESKIEVNGLFKDVKNNPYKKVYFNGSSKRRSVSSLYGSSMSEPPSSSDEKPKDNKENRLHTDTEDEKPSVSNSTKKKSSVPRKPNNVSKVVERKRRKKHSSANRTNVDSSSEEDIKPSKKDWGQLSRSKLSQIDKELGESASDSGDELIPIKSFNKDDNHKTTAKSMSSIYSDTDSSDDSGKNDDKSSNATSDSQSKLRTKAAVKEFSHKPSKGNNKTANNSTETKKKPKVEEAKKDKEKDTKKKDYVPSDLIVPQRQAAKKATENLKTTTTSRNKEHPAPVEESPPKVEEKQKQKSKTKAGKEIDIKEKQVKEIKDKEPKDVVKEDDKPKEKEQIKEIKEKKKEKEKESKQAVEEFEVDKELEKTEPQELLYVPQRQAAKKAAEHIKSGLGKPVVPQPTDTPVAQETLDKSKKDSEVKKVDVPKKPEMKKEAEQPAKPAKVSENKRKSSTNSSSNSSSSSSSSSDSSSSSSSDSDEEAAVVEKEAQQPRSESNKRSTAKDLPFLDKGARSAATSGSSSSSDSSPPTSPTKKTKSPSPIPPASRTDSPSRAANELPKTKRSPDKKQPSATAKREEHQISRPSRGRGRAPRGRARLSNSGERLGDANVRSRDLSDGQRVGLDGEPKPAKGRKGKSTSRDTTVDEKETAEGKLLSPVRKTDKKLKETKTAEIATLEKEILERKVDKEGPTIKSKSSMFERLFGTPEKKEDKSEKVEKHDKVKKDLMKVIEKPPKSTERPLIAPEKLTIPDKSNSTDKSKTTSDKANKVLEKSKSVEEKKSPQRSVLLEKSKTDDITKAFSLPDLSEKSTKPLDKQTKSDSLIKSPNKELKEQIEKKLEQKELKEQIEKKDDRKATNKKPAVKTKSIDDIFANKLSSSDTKENKIEIKKPPTPKQSKTSDEITLADKIVDDHLQTHKAKDLYNRQAEVVQEVFNATPDVTKTLLNDLEAEKKNSLKPSGITNQVLQNRSIFSPQPHVKDADFLDLGYFEDIAISKDEDLIKNWNFTSNNPIIREDTKEDSARETLNLVEKLRMGLSKKSGAGEMDEATTSEMEPQLEFPQEQTAKCTTKDDKEKPSVELELKVQVTQIAPAKGFPELNKDAQDYNYINNIPSDLPKDIVQQNESLTDHTAPVQGDERWVPPSENYPNVQAVDPRNYIDSVVPSISSELPAMGSDSVVSSIVPDSVVSSIVPDSVLPSIVTDSVVPPMVPHYLEQYTNNSTDNQEHHKKQLNSLPAQLEARLQEEILKSHSPSIQDRIDRRISQTPLIDPSSMDCMNSPMPYVNIHPQAKWADCEVIPNRRSVSRSSSSSSSSTSSSSRRDEEEPRLPLSHASLDVASSYLPNQAPSSYPPNPMDNFGGFTPDGSCYPVSLFPPPNLNTQLPFPSTGPAPMYHPPAFGAPFPAPTHSIPPMSSTKPLEESSVNSYSSTCTAAFTSSQHNMAFTAAMVNMPPSTATSKPIEEQLEQQLDDQLLGTPAAIEPLAPPSLTPTTSTEEVAPSPALSNTTPTPNSTLPSPSMSQKSNSSAGKKSPSKPTRTSARVSSQMMNKSPAKSPGKSPRQETALKQSGPGRGRGDNKRGTGKTGVSRGAGALRGRGRGRGRGRSSHNSDFDFLTSGTIHNKLVGTVYDLDFDDDISNDNMTDLKSMRERRKSLDVHERKFEPFSSTRDSPRSPKFSSPSQTSHKGRSYNTDLRELRPPTPIEDSRSKTDVSLTSSDNEPPQAFPDVTPPLPGPVDMRTYNSNFDQQTYNEQNLLSAFASGTAETQIQEIDEDFEKELHSTLAKKPVEPPPPSSEASNNIKVSLSDSRNQLKVKIKGPIANYTSTVAPLPPLPPPTLDSSVPVTINSVANNVIINSAAMGLGAASSGGGGGPSSLRRMRKKELLRQYWTQDMNMDDPASNTGFTAPAAPPVNRTIITIPKAVASMTSIPTKEDYRDYRTDSDDFVDSKHHRKESKSRPLSRELRQLDLTDNDGHLERRRSIGSLSGNSNSSFDSALANKRRGRPTRPSSQQPPQSQPSVTPKLKIKIGNNTNSIVGELETPHDKRDRIRPPKKRLAATQNKPSVEDLKRESMKFRKMMMKDLKIKHKKDKSEKKKKKKLKSEVQIIASAAENPTKLIIRFGKKSDSDNERRTSGESDESKTNSGTGSTGADKPLPEPNDDNKEKPPPVKLIPIKLKFSRCQEGSGYVMKPPVHNTEKEEEERAVQPGQPPPPDTEPPPTQVVSEPASPPPPVLDPNPPVLAVNKDCEVR